MAFRNGGIPASSTDVDNPFLSLPRPIFHALSSAAPTDELNCSICYELMLDPAKTPCNHVFCRHCITTHILGGSDVEKEFCPIDRKPLTFNELSNIEGTLRRKWSSISITCSKCVAWTGTLLHYKYHLQSSCTSTPYVKELEQRIKDMELIHQKKIRDKDDIICKKDKELQNYIHSNYEMVPECDPGYRYNRDRVVELSRLICYFLENKPNHINQNRIYNCIKCIYDDLVHGYSDNPPSYDVDVHMLLSISKASTWFTPNQHNRFCEWIQNYDW